MYLGSVLKKAAVLRKCVEEGECVVNQVHPIPGTGVTRNDEVPLEVTAVPSTITQECRAEWPTGEIAKFGYFISS